MSTVPKISKFRTAQMVKRAVLASFKMIKIDFTENLSGRKILKVSLSVILILTSETMNDLFSVFNVDNA